MKKLILLLVTFVLNSFLSAQSKAITVNPLGLFWGVLNAQYEYRYDADNSIALRANFVGYDLSGFSNSAFGLGGTYRWYHLTKPVIGLWYGPSADLLFWTAKEKNRLTPSTYSSAFFGLGGDVGYKWNFNHFGVEIYGGIRYYFGDIAGLAFGGASLIAGLNLGYVW